MKIPVVPSPEISTFVTGATVAFRADYDGDTLLSADVGGTGSRYGLRGLQRIGKNLRMPKDTLLGTKIHIPTKGSF